MDDAKRMRFLCLCMGIGFDDARADPVRVFIFMSIIVAAILVPLVFGGIGLAVAIFGIRIPAKTLRESPNRATYLLTNRRAIIHSGSATQIYMGRGSGAAVAGQNSITPFTGPELLKIRRIENTKYEGAGAVAFAHSALEEASGGGFRNINDIAKVEKLIRVHLINPLIDKLLRGEKLGGEEEAKLKKEEKESGKDDNIKDAPGVTSAKAPRSMTITSRTLPATARTRAAWPSATTTSSRRPARPWRTR